MTRAVLGIIGGSGIYDLPGLEDVRDEVIESPWGKPSSTLRRGTIAGLPIVFLSRHDKGHRLSPSDINYRANIDVLKRAGVTDLITLSACGSFKEELPPGTFVLVDQFVDRTYKRESSFFGAGCVAHVSMAHPVSPRLRIHLAAAAEAEGIPIVRGGTSSTQKALFFNLRRIRARLAQEKGDIGEAAIDREVAATLGVPVGDVAAMGARLSGPDASLNAPLYDRDEASGERQDALVADQIDVDEAVGATIDGERRLRWLDEALTVLDERELKIVRERRLAGDGETLETIGRRLGISKERVRQIEARALEKLRSALLARQPDRAAFV